MNPDDLRKADALEIVVGQGAKPGGGGMLLGQKINDRVAEMRTLPKGIDQRSPCRHPDWTGPDDMEIKILELREITGWKVPIFVKVAGSSTYCMLKITFGTSLKENDYNWSKLFLSGVISSMILQLNAC